MVKNLVFGYINTNVIDGSAVFMSSLCNVLAKNVKSNTDLLLAVPLKRNTILSGVEKKSNVNIIDPYDDSSFKEFDLVLREQITIEEAAKLIIHCEKINKYDRIFIRSLDVTKELLKLDPNLISKTYSYITGITSSNQVLDKEEYSFFNEIESLKGKFLCQTNEMKEHILKYISIDESSILDLNPMIPDLPFSYEEIFQKKDIYSTFVYTGKFAKEWNTVPMIVGFREIIESFDATLNVAGDQFKKHDEFERFIPNAEYLLKNTKKLNWYKALNRNQSLNLISNSDIGLSWRAQDLDDSLELSTKLLEYCSLGKPPIINKTEMHVRIFGEDYPYYCNNLISYIETLKYIIEYPEVYENVSKLVFDIAQDYTFTNTAKKLYTKLGDSEFTFTDTDENDKIGFFEKYELPNNDYLDDVTSIKNNEDLRRMHDYANKANEKYKHAMKKLIATKEFAEVANNKYKETMEKHKKAVSDYNYMKNEKNKLKKELKELQQYLSKTQD